MKNEAAAKSNFPEERALNSENGTNHPPHDVEGFFAETEARKVIEKIDTPALKKLFDELRERAGATEEGGFIDPPDIRFGRCGENGGMVGEYDVRGVIKINPHKLREMLTRLGDYDSPEDFHAVVLRTIIHEETHASAKNTERSFFKTRLLFVLAAIMDKKRSFGVTGYQRLTADLNELHGDEFVAFNEGVTEKIAREVFDEYLTRTGDRTFFATDGKSVSPWAYENMILFADLFIEALAYVCQIPKDKVWEAVKGGYMQGVDLGATELRVFFENTFGPHIVDCLRKNPSPRALVDNLHQLSISENQREKLFQTFNAWNSKKAELQPKL